MARIRSRVRLQLDDGRVVLGTSEIPRWILRALFRRNMRGVPPVLVLTDTSGEAIEIAPGTVADVLVAAYEGPDQ